MCILCRQIIPTIGSLDFQSDFQFDYKICGDFSQSYLQFWSFLYLESMLEGIESFLLSSKFVNLLQKSLHLRVGISQFESKQDSHLKSLHICVLRVLIMVFWSITARITFGTSLLRCYASCQQSSHQESQGPQRKGHFAWFRLQQECPTSAKYLWCWVTVAMLVVLFQIHSWHFDS